MRRDHPCAATALRRARTRQFYSPAYFPPTYFPYQSITRRIARASLSGRHAHLSKLSFFQSSNTGGWGSRPGGSAPNVTAATKVSGEQDIEVQPGVTDTVSALAFSPTADVLAVASWDNHVRIYRIDKSNAQPVQPWQQYTHEGPVLDVCFSGDGSKVISGGADKVARCFDLNTNQASVVAQQDDTIRCVRWLQAFGGALVTGGWDKKVKIWKIEPQPTLITTLDLPERVYAMDVIGPIIIVATAERKILAYQCNDATGTAQQVVVRNACGAATDSRTNRARSNTRRVRLRRYPKATASHWVAARAALPCTTSMTRRTRRTAKCTSSALGVADLQQEVRIPLPPACKCRPPRRAAQRDDAVLGELHQVQRPGHVRDRRRRRLDQLLVQGEPNTAQEYVRARELN